jgi:hypothetical protein
MAVWKYLSSERGKKRIYGAFSLYILFTRHRMPMLACILAVVGQVHVEWLLREEKSTIRVL